MVSDEDWQSWVLARLKQCSLAVIDVSDGFTNGISWELQKMLKIVPRSRIIIVHGDFSTAWRVGIDASVFTLNSSAYVKASPKAQRSIRKQLNEWLRK